jgi:DinB family protein
MSPVKKATSTRHAKAKRAAKRSGRRARAKRAAQTSGAPKGSPRRTGAKAKGGGRRARSEARKPQLAVVARPAPRQPRRKPRPAFTEFAGARAGASPKDLALFGLERARVAVHAAIQGLSAGAADQPIAPGKWSPRQLLLQLAHWDREIVQKHLEAAAALNQRADLRRSRLDALDEAGLAALGHPDWEGAKRLLQNTYEDLWDAFDSIPDEPADVWSPEHALGELVREVTNHDRRHADVIKRWRAEAGLGRRPSKERTP